jgi:hypothetical protein
MKRPGAAHKAEMTGVRSQVQNRAWRAFGESFLDIALLGGKVIGCVALGARVPAPPGCPRFRRLEPVELAPQSLEQRR